MLRRTRELFSLDDPETGWLMRLLGTALLAGTLLSGRPEELTGWGSAVLGASFACWLAFAVLEPRWPRFGLAALASCSALAAPMVGMPSAAALTVASIALLVLASHLAPSATTILAVAGADLALALLGFLLWRQSAVAMLGATALMLIMVLLGLNRRQYRVRARQTEQLLEQTRLVQDEQARSAALDERARIAREVHDVLAHSLGALGVQLELAEALLTEKGDPAAAAERVRRSRRLASEGLAEARGAVAALRRGDVPPLAEALAGLAETHRRDHGAPVGLRTDGTPRAVSSAATVSLLGAAREALTNAAKHAPGAAVDIALDYGDEGVRLRVRNGAPSAGKVAGRRSSSSRGGGYGLTGMRERIALVGGTLSAGREGAPSDGSAGEGAGWQVTAEVPE